MVIDSSVPYGSDDKGGSRLVRPCILILWVLLMAVGLGGCAAGSDPITLTVYNWGDYIDEGIITQFEQEYNIKVNYITFERNEDLYTALKNPSTVIDVCIPSEYMIERLINENMLEELEHGNIPNSRYIMERFKALSFDPHQRYSIPYFWGFVGIVYNESLVDAPVDSWSVLWDPRYSGRILMMDSPRDAFMIALKKMNISMNTALDDELKAAKSELLLQHPLVLAYANDSIKAMMINEEAALAPAWSGEALYMMHKNDRLAFAVPKEGTNLWFDNLVIPKATKHKKEAELFIDFMCRPDIALRNAYFMSYSTPNQGAFDMMSEDLKQNRVAYPDAAFQDSCEVYKDLGPGYIERLNRDWTEIKSVR